MLILQDIGLGAFMALLPILAGHKSEQGHSFATMPNEGRVHQWFHGALGGKYWYAVYVYK